MLICERLCRPTLTEHFRDSADRKRADKPYFKLQDLLFNLIPEITDTRTTTGE